MNQAKKMILVIDDEPQMRELLKKRLEVNQFECVTVENAVEGLKNIIQIKPHLILLDLMLPLMSGLGFLRILKGNPHMAEIPVIVLSALKDDEVRHEVRELGAADYLLKTCEPHELLHAIQSHIL